MKILRALATRIRAHFGLTRNSKKMLAEALNEWREFMVRAEGQNFQSKVVPCSSEKDSSFGGNLQDFGIAIVSEFLDRTSCLETSESVFNDLQQLRSGSTNTEWRGAKVINPDDATPGYTSMALGKSPVIYIRGGSDYGMVDIFHPEKLYPQIEHLVASIRSSSLEGVISSASGTKMALQNVNLYVNQDVEQTRGFHVDSWGVNQYKAFVYLTDVDNLADGPYTYVLGSPNNPELETLNKQLNLSFGKTQLTDVGVFHPTKVMPLLAKAGSLVVSNQTGAHGGWPQSKGHRRCVLTLNFRES